MEYCHWAGAKLGIEDLRSFRNEPLFILGIDDERLPEVLEGSQLRQVLLGGRWICTFILTIYYCKLLHSCQRKYSICYSGIQSSLESSQISMSCKITRDITYYVPTCSPEQPRLMPKENQKMSHEQRVYLIMKIKRIKQIENNAQCRETFCTASSTLRGAWSLPAPLAGASALSAVVSDGDTNIVGDFGENGSETTLPSGDCSC